MNIMARTGSMLKNLRNSGNSKGNIQTRAADKLFQVDLVKMISQTSSHQCLVVAEKAGEEAGKQNSVGRIIMQNCSLTFMTLINRTSKQLRSMINTFVSPSQK